MANYPKADAKKQWFQDDYPGSKLKLTAGELIVVLHTTEGLNYPGYNDGATAPNYTGQPPVGSRKGSWRAHFPDDRSSRALRNEKGGVETNTSNCIQLELIGTCDPKHKKSWNGQGKSLAGRDYVYWPDATDAQLSWLADILAYFHKTYGLKLVAPKPFKAYPSSYGNNGVRISQKNWAGTSGVIGHQHVPENSHGDPGNIRIAFLLQRAKTLAFPKGPPKALTRGVAVDSAIKALRNAKGEGVRGELIRSALNTLLEIKPL